MKKGVVLIGLLALYLTGLAREVTAITVPLSTSKATVGFYGNTASTAPKMPNEGNSISEGQRFSADSRDKAALGGNALSAKSATQAGARSLPDTGDRSTPLLITSGNLLILTAVLLGNTEKNHQKSRLGLS